MILLYHLMIIYLNDITVSFDNTDITVSFDNTDITVSNDILATGRVPLLGHKFRRFHLLKKKRKSKYLE
ncbi:hypothetical protein CDAR_118641 [Caerostris darwini]|uniref:Uncharacterized protein n=1 Tax=Caerostris darwini TaxID=1538125 RepID=A0AAV4X1P1_9ARAC|nr:hypothetical protein CDAR_118641 [Caerostris darwini]